MFSLSTLRETAYNYWFKTLHPFNSYLSHRRHYRQPSVDIKVKNYNLLVPRGKRPELKKTGINSMIFILLFMENCL